MSAFNYNLVFFNLSFILVVFVVMLLLSVGVAFFTLFERKVMGSFHIRKGPNKVWFMGEFQPFSDALKLFSKEVGVPVLSSEFFFICVPMFSFFLSLVCWLGLVEVFSSWSLVEFSVMFMFCVMSLNAYSILVGGWISKSIYAVLSSVRGVAQVISYEVVLIFMVLVFLLSVESVSLFKLMIYQEYCGFWVEYYILGVSGFLMILAELNRSPFDLLESESELVSGYNVEFGYSGFGMFFLMENLMIIFWCILFISLFWGGGAMMLSMCFVLYLFVWERMVFPRYRYDKLMELMWVYILLFYLFMFIFFYGVKFIYFSNFY